MTRRYPPNLKRPKTGQADWREMAQDNCQNCNGKGTVPRAGFLIVFDEKCSSCDGTGKKKLQQNLRK